MIAIKGMEMPENCTYCPCGRKFGEAGGVECLVIFDGKHCVAGYDYIVEKPDWCPLVEISDSK